ncbi:hypothetical protein VULLAG_LOCUS7695 [Vulpes lagopus]
MMIPARSARLQAPPPASCTLQRGSRKLALRQRSGETRSAAVAFAGLAGFLPHVSPLEFLERPGRPRPGVLGAPPCGAAGLHRQRGGGRPGSPELLHVALPGRLLRSHSQVLSFRR